jgi:protein MpaA
MRLILLCWLLMIGVARASALDGLSQPGFHLLGRSAGGRTIGLERYGSGSDVTLLLGGFHGDEPGGSYLLGLLGDWLGAHDACLLGRSVVLVDIVNPDGLAARTRVNADRVDLNRNFPTHNWKLTAHDRNWGGPQPASEPETRMLIDVLRRVQPARIVSIHAPLHMVNYDGPALDLAQAMAALNGYAVSADIGYPTPGSFGTYAGVERHIPTITLELPDQPLPYLWETNRDALLAAVMGGDHAAPGPREVIDSFYDWLSQHEGGRPLASQRAHFEPALYDALVKAQELQPPGPFLDVDPFYDSQGFTRFGSASVEHNDGERATVRVVLIDGRAPGPGETRHSVWYTLHRHDGAWRISDLSYPPEHKMPSLLRYLKKLNYDAIQYRSSHP